MSCNGCRALRKGCSTACALRSCLHWIETPAEQANATLFLAKFFGRSDLLSFISAVPEPQRPALFQSLLYEACGRTVNPVNGAVGLLLSGNWGVCEAAVETVLAGGDLSPVSDSMASARSGAEGSTGQSAHQQQMPSDLLGQGMVPRGRLSGSGTRRCMAERRRDYVDASSSGEELSSLGTTSFVSGGVDDRKRRMMPGAGEEVKLLNLFV